MVHGLGQPARVEDGKHGDPEHLDLGKKKKGKAHAGPPPNQAREIHAQSTRRKKK